MRIATKCNDPIGDRMAVRVSDGNPAVTLPLRGILEPVTAREQFGVHDEDRRTEETQATRFIGPRSHLALGIGARRFRRCGKT